MISLATLLRGLLAIAQTQKSGINILADREARKSIKKNKFDKKDHALAASRQRKG